MKITSELSIDAARRNRCAVVVAKQYDKQSRFLRIALLNNERPFIVDQNATVLINARRPDGAGKSFVGTVNENGTVTVPLTYWMLELSGIVKCDITVVMDNDVTLSSMLFELDVEEAACDEDCIGADDKYSLLLTLIQTARDSTSAADTAARNASQAAQDANTAAAAAYNTANAAVSANAAAQAAMGAALEANTAAGAANTAAGRAEAAIQGALAAKEACTNMVTNAQLVTNPLLVADLDTGKQYTAAIQIHNGKPVMVYEEIDN